MLSMAMTCIGELLEEMDVKPTMSEKKMVTAWNDSGSTGSLAINFLATVGGRSSLSKFSLLFRSMLSATVFS